ncbi:MAG TPA: sigma-70 family RNA polymerase sigma factor [Candidatus Limnocylindrales bacterium]|jgi:RNA polymerase sigma-70 factor (ECF subfamily)|nr:sigma-70 family RNA polymerase sigma factor [Candidatus Limnocylindrales bacterium]
MPRVASESLQRTDREQAFDVFAGPRLDRAYGLARRLVGDHDAEDACQEALLAAWSAWPRLRDQNRFDAWFDRILVNACIELLRRRARRPQTTLDDGPGLVRTDAATGSAEHDAMARALARLSPEHRAAVVLRFWADLTTDAIADRLGVPAGTVRSRLHYALDALRADLGREVTDE